MTRQAAILALLILGLIGACASYLKNQQSRQRLGEPGVRVVSEPIFSKDILGTNPAVLVSNRSVYLPRRVLDYQGEDGYVAPITVTVVPKDTTFGHRIYRNGSRTIDCQVLLMGADRSTIHRPQFCLQGTGWQTISSEPKEIQVERPHSYQLPVRVLKLRHPVEQEGKVVGVEGGVFVYWFVADGEITNGHYERQWLMTRELLMTGVLQRWAYVICFAQCPPGQEDAAFEDIKRFIAAAVPEFQVTSDKAASDR